MEKEILDKKISLKKLKKTEKKKEKENVKKENKIYLNIYKELVEITNFFIYSKNINENSNIKNYIKYPNIFNYDKLKEKILSIFSLKTDNEIFIYFINIFGDLNEKWKGKLNLEILNIFSLLLFFKGDNFLNNKNNDVKNKAISLFTKVIILNKANSLEELKIYIYFFNIYSELKDYYSIHNSIDNYEDLIKLKIINIFSLQKLYSYKIFPLIQIENTEKNFIEEEEKENKIFKSDYKNYLIQYMYNTYIRNDELFPFFHEYIMKNIQLNSIKPHYIKMILDNNNNNKNLKEEFINSLVLDLMEKPEINNYYELLNYYNIIYEYNLESNFINIDKEINEFLNFLINKIHAYGKVMRVIKYLNEKTRLSLDKKLLKEVLFNLPINDKENIKIFLEYFPQYINSFYQYYLKKSNESELINITRIIPNIILPNNIKNQLNKKTEIIFMNYKIREEADHFDIICDFALTNENTLTYSINKYLEKSKEKNEEQNLNYEKYLYLINKGIEKGILNKKNYKNYKISTIKFPKDFFGPHDKNCISYTREEINVSFIDSLNKLETEYSKFFVNSEYIGIDTEWKQQMNLENKIEVSIIQMCDFTEKNIMIIDLITLNKINNFYEYFEKMFKNKKFIGFSFDKNDLLALPSQISKILLNCEFYDIIDLYQYNLLKKARSLKYTCEEILGKSLCKYEQCSNWEMRPLKESQLHYASLDSLVCIKLFKKLYK